MGRRRAGLGFREVARVGAVAVAGLALAQCSAQMAGTESRYSPRVVEDGEPVPKGGGTYSVGKPYNVNGRTYVPAENPHYRAEGMASWYGPDFHGRLTANGEVYDMHAISAAHTTMPLPSYARVTNLDNNRSIIVRVNDRGPYARNRIIDLSIGTAKALDFYGRGVAHVRVEYVGRAPMAGTDDSLLLATLREGSPAPAPSSVMVASAKPFVSNLSDASGTPLPPERPFTLGGAPGRGTEVAAAPSTRSRMSTRAAVATPAEAQAETESLASVPSSTGQSSAFAPGPPALGLMSGRGLY